jgi:hypothetical protein
VLRRFLNQLRLDHSAHHFQVLWCADALRVCARSSRRGRLLFFLSQFDAAIGQSIEQQFQSCGVQLLALLAEETPRQRIELLAQQRCSPVGLEPRPRLFHAANSAKPVPVN